MECRFFVYKKRGYLGLSKGDRRFPELALKAAITYLDINANDISDVVYYEDPKLKLQRVQNFSPFIDNDHIIERFRKIESVVLQCINRIFKGTVVDHLHIGYHHLSHACSTLMVSPFMLADSHILCFDAVGEWESSSYWQYDVEEGIRQVDTSSYPNSLGLFYSAVTSYLGFKVNSGEYKVMGLAPYGKPVYFESIMDNVIQINLDGHSSDYFPFKINSVFIAPHINGCAFRSSLEELLGPSRSQEKELEQRHFDLAASFQRALEYTIDVTLQRIVGNGYSDNICMAGGVALNCTANGFLRRKYSSLNFFIQPAAGDAGGALGAALSLHIKNDKRGHKSAYAPNSTGLNNSSFNPYLGVSYDDEAILTSLKDNGVNKCFEYYLLDTDSSLCSTTAEYLREGMVVGWFQGRQEFGPRALGSRSILANPCVQDMQIKLNLKVKFRESFRPFAPSVLDTCFHQYFDGVADEYMLTTTPLKNRFFKDGFLSESYQSLTAEDKVRYQRSDFNAITHVDGSARCQIVSDDLNPLFYMLITKFYNITGVGMLVNTSFNVRGEPIVMTPSDAINCFLSTNIDILVIGRYIVSKTTKWKQIDFDHLNARALD